MKETTVVAMAIVIAGILLFSLIASNFMKDKMYVENKYCQAHRDGWTVWEPCEAGVKKGDVNV